MDPEVLKEILRDYLTIKESEGSLFSIAYQEALTEYTDNQ